MMMLIHCSKQTTYVAFYISASQCLCSSNSFSTPPPPPTITIHRSYHHDMSELTYPFDTSLLQKYPSFYPTSQLPCLLTSDDADVEDDVDVLNLLLLLAAPTPVKRCLRCVCKIRIKQGEEGVEIKKGIISNICKM